MSDIDPVHPSKSYRSLYIPLLLIFALLAAGAFLPDRRLWGVNHLAFYPLPVRLACLAFVAMSFVPGVATSVYSAFLSRAQQSTRGIVAIVFAPVVAVIVFWVLRSSTLLLGDGVLAANNLDLVIDKGVTTIDYLRLVTPSETIYPATGFLFFLAGQAANLAGAVPIVGVRVVNVIAGGLFILALLLYLRRSAQAPALKMTITVFILAAGGIQLFFGYVEYYAPAILLTSVYVLLAVRTLHRGSGWLLGWVLLAAVVFHIGALLFVPSFLVVLLWRKFGKTQPRWLNRAPWLVFGAVLAGTLVAGRFAPLADHFLPFARGTYSVFSTEHLIDILNVMILIVPMFLFFGWMMILCRPADGKQDPETLLAWSLFGPSALFVLMFRPELGMARDWDLFCLAAGGFFAVTFVALKRAFAHPVLARDIGRYISPAIAMSVVLVTAWIGVNASPSRSVARYKSILEYDKTRADYAYESLAMFYHERADIGAEMASLQKAYDHARQPRFLFKMSNVYLAAGDSINAIGGFLEVLRQKPDYDDVRVALIAVLFARGDDARLIDVARQGIEMSPDDPFYHYILGRALLRSGLVKDALQAFIACLDRHPPEYMVTEMYQVIASTPGLGEHAVRALKGQNE